MRTSVWSEISCGLVLALALLGCATLPPAVAANSQALAASSRQLLAANCTTVQRCGASCVTCPRPANGRPVCVNKAGNLTCSVRCNAGFTTSVVRGTITCRRFTTCLTLKDKGLRSPRNQTRRGYQTSRRLANIVGNMGAKGPVTPEQLQQTLQASCTAEDMAASGCADVLLLVLTPPTYSSNNTADTPGGRAFISPAQDQAGCAACVGFAVTAAAEAAVNVYKQQSWDKLSLSEQDLSFCKLLPRLDCSAGANYGDIIRQVTAGDIKRLASRGCYPYKAASGGSFNCLRADACKSELPEDGRFTMAYDGSSLNTVAKVKEQIMLNGGVLTSMAIGPTDTFRTYDGRTAGGVYDPRDITDVSTAELHALFCYGWSDNIGRPGEGSWLCKNSWGTSWGISGTVRVAYGSAYIMQDDYTFALSFGPNTVAAIEADIVARLQQGLSSDATTPGCMLYKTLDNTRLISLLNDAITLSNLLGSALASSDILADVVSSNLGYMPVLSAASRGPFRVCGATGAWLSTYVDATSHASPSPSAISPSPAPSPSPRACFNNPPATLLPNVAWSCGTSTTSGGRCTATGCTAGYVVVGTVSATCQDGVWGSPRGSCQQVPPGPSPNPSFGINPSPAPVTVDLASGQQMMVGLPQRYNRNTTEWILDSPLSSSVDAGYSWSSPTSVPGDGEWVYVAMSCSGTMRFAGYRRTTPSSGRLWASMDAGATWTYVDDNGPYPNVLSTNDAGTRVAVGSWEAVYIGDRKETGKFSWRRALDVAATGDLLVVMSGNGTTVVAWPDVIGNPAGMFKTMYISRDGGLNWSQQDPAEASSDLRSGLPIWRRVAVSADGTYMAAIRVDAMRRGSSNNSIHTSNNVGRDWVRSVVTSDDLLRLAMSRDGNYIVVAGGATNCIDYALWISADRGITWQRKIGTFRYILDIACSSTCSTLAVLGQAVGDSSIAVYIRYNFSDAFQRSTSLPGQDVAAANYYGAEGPFIAISTCNA